MVMMECPAGRLAGYLYTGSSTTERTGTRWTTQGTPWFEYLATLGAGAPSEAIGVNEDGHAVGFSYDSNGDWRPVLWPSWGGVIQLFGDNAVEPGSWYAQANDVNEGRDVVGYYYYYGCCALKAFFQPGYGSPTNIGSLGSGPTVATAVNNNEQVVGYSKTPGGVTSAFIWDQGTGMVDLFAGVGWASASQALDVNDRGQVVGTYYSPSLGMERGFFYDPNTGLWDIGDLDPTGDSETGAYGINERGQITGFSYNGSGSLRAFVRSTGDWDDI